MQRFLWWESGQGMGLDRQHVQGVECPQKPTAKRRQAAPGASETGKNQSLIDKWPWGANKDINIEAAMTDKPETCLGAVTLVDTRTGLAQAHKA